MADDKGGTDRATVTVEVAPYVGPGADELVQFRELFAEHSAAIDDLDAQIRTVTVEIQQLQQQNPRDDNLIQQKVIEQQNLLPQRNSATEVFATVVFRFNQLKDQIVRNV